MKFSYVTKVMKKVDLIVIIIFHGKDYITVNIKET